MNGSDGNETADAVEKAARRAVNQLGIQASTLITLFGTPPSVTRDFMAGSPFPDHAEVQSQLLRIIELYVAVRTALNDETQAKAWLHGHNTALGAAPETLLRSQVGLGRVLDYLNGHINR